MGFSTSQKTSLTTVLLLKKMPALWRWCGWPKQSFRIPQPPAKLIKNNSGIIYVDAIINHETSEDKIGDHLSANMNLPRGQETGAAKLPVVNTVDCGQRWRLWQPNTLRFDDKRNIRSLKEIAKKKQDEDSCNVYPGIGELSQVFDWKCLRPRHANLDDQNEILVTMIIFII